MRIRIVGVVSAVSVFVAAVAFAADLSESNLINESMNMAPLSAEQSAQLRAQRDDAKAKWAKMTPEQQAAVKQSARQKKTGDLTAMERMGQNDDMAAMTKAETAQSKAERQAAEATYAKMTPAEKAAQRKATQQKRLADLNAIERVGQNDDMGRYLAH